MDAGAYTVMIWLRPLPQGPLSTPLIVYDTAPRNTLLLAAWARLLLASTASNMQSSMVGTFSSVLFPNTFLLFSVQLNPTYVLGSHLLQAATPWQIPTASCTSSFKNASLPMYSPVYLSPSLTSLFYKFGEPEDWLVYLIHCRISSTLNSAHWIM